MHTYIIVRCEPEHRDMFYFCAEQGSSSIFFFCFWWNFCPDEAQHHSRSEYRVSSLDTSLLHIGQNVILSIAL